MEIPSTTKTQIAPVPQVKRGFRFSIGAKIVFLMGIILIGSTSSLVWISTRIFIDSDTAFIQQTNADTAANLAAQVHELLRNLTDKLRIVGILLYEEKSVSSTNVGQQTTTPSVISAPDVESSGLGQETTSSGNHSVATFTANSELNQRLIAEFFSKDKDLLAVYLEGAQGDNQFSVIAEVLSPQLSSALSDSTHTESTKSTAADAEESSDGTTHTAATAAIKADTTSSILDQILMDKDFSLAATAEGEPQISSVQLADGSSAVSVGIPFMQDPQNPNHFTHLLIGVVRQERFIKAFSENSIVTSYLVDRRGKLIAHPDTQLVNSRANLSQMPIVKQLLEGKFNNGQTSYVDPKTNEAKLGAFRVVGLAHLGVIAEIPAAKAFEAARKVEYRSALVAWVIICFAFLIGYLFSNTITWPIRLLSNAAQQISEGNFNIQLQPRGNDEIAELSSTFNHMAEGLAERDRVKAMFNKFHNREITEKLLSGELKLGGERKEATVFFSDIRGFTSLSESLSPEEVVEMLNEYLTRMVAIIRNHGGVVDKYVGDAIMALWGVPLTGENDTANAITACLAMRRELAVLNELRISRNQPILKIGMGLNKGPLIAGNIGSDEKMEYTVIGDAVNLASRIESLTKEYGTDLLISKSIYQEIKSQFILEAADSAQVKGKTELVAIYKVQGFYDQDHQPVLVQTPYSSYPPEHSDKVIHAEPKSENKTEPLGYALPPPFSKKKSIA